MNLHTELLLHDNMRHHLLRIHSLSLQLSLKRKPRRKTFQFRLNTMLTSSELPTLLVLLVFVPGTQPLAAEDFEAPRAANAPFRHLTDQTLQELPVAQRPVWHQYIADSRSAAQAEYTQLQAELSAARLKSPRQPPSNSREFEVSGQHDDAWHASDEALQLADTVISFQTPTGGWSKAVDYSKGPRTTGMHWTTQSGSGWHYCGTLDNRSTTEQIRFLARVHQQTQRTDCRDAAARGIHWLLKAQYPSGGWPQNYPVEPGYHEAITLNDNAMLHAMELMLHVSRGDAPFRFCSETQRQAATKAFANALTCLQQAHINTKDGPAAWCAQHHPVTLQPVAARTKEPPSISGAESAEMLKFLMRDGPLDPATTHLIRQSLHWFDTHRITGLKKTKNSAGKTDYLPDPDSQEIYWARFYDLETCRPIFAGSQDAKIYDSFTEMARHNKVGYDYFTTRPKELLEKELPRWEKRRGAGQQ